MLKFYEKRTGDLDVIERWIQHKKEVMGAILCFVKAVMAKTEKFSFVIRGFTYFAVTKKRVFNTS